MTSQYDIHWKLCYNKFDLQHLLFLQSDFQLSDPIHPRIGRWLPGVLHDVCAHLVQDAHHFVCETLTNESHVFVQLEELIDLL